MDIDKLIKLFRSTEANFDHNEWVLSECTVAKVTEDLEGILDLNLEYPLYDSKELSQYLVKGNIIQCPISQTDIREKQLFRIRKRIKNTKTKRVTIYAQAIARADLMKNWIAGCRVLAGNTRKRAIAQILASCVEQQGYYVGNLDTNTNTSINLGLEEDTGNVINYLDIDAKNPLAGLIGDEKSVKKAYGGELIFNNKEINIVDERGTDHSFIISSGKNLEELEEEIDDMDSESFATALTMRSSDGLYLPNQEIIYSPNAATLGNYFKLIVCDDVTLVNNTDEAIQIVYAQLRERAQKAFDNGIDKLKANNTINFIQLANTEECKNYAELEKCEIGNNVTVKYPRAKVETTGRVIKIVFNVLKMKIEETEIGERRKPTFVETVTNAVTKTVELNDKHNDNKVKINKVKKATSDINSHIVIMEAKDDSIELSVADLSKNTKAALEIQDEEISLSVKKEEFGAYLTMHYNEIMAAVNDGTNHTVTLNGDGLSVGNGAFTVRDSSGTIVFRVNLNSAIGMQDLSLGSSALVKGSSFYNTLMGMEEVYFREIKTNRLTIDEKDFYIYHNDSGGYGLKNYVETILSEKGLI